MQASTIPLFTPAQQRFLLVRHGLWALRITVVVGGLAVLYATGVLHL